MSLKVRLVNICLSVIADTLADLQGLREEIRGEAEARQPERGFRIDRHATPLSALIRFRRARIRSWRG